MDNWFYKYILKVSFIPYNIFLINLDKVLGGLELWPIAVKIKLTKKKKKKILLKKKILVDSRLQIVYGGTCLVSFGFQMIHGISQLHPINEAFLPANNTSLFWPFYIFYVPDRSNSHVSARRISHLGVGSGRQCQSNLEYQLGQTGPHTDQPLSLTKWLLKARQNHYKS